VLGIMVGLMLVHPLETVERARNVHDCKIACRTVYACLPLHNVKYDKIDNLEFLIPNDDVNYRRHREHPAHDAIKSKMIWTLSPSLSGTP
jgi:hypothetical protein